MTYSYSYSYSYPTLPYPTLQAARGTHHEQRRLARPRPPAHAHLSTTPYMQSLTDADTPLHVYKALSI